MTATIREQTEAVIAEFATRPEGLRQHVERVLVEALELAPHYDLDHERVALAVWGHDLFRAYAPEQLLSLAAEVGAPVAPEDELEPVLLHGPIAAIVLRERFGVADDDALAAVRDHTLGLGEMPLIAKVILVADKVEARKRKRTPVMAEIRKLARRDLDAALLCLADWKWVEERTNEWNSHPTHWRARQHWVGAHHIDAALPARLAVEAFASEPGS